MSYQDLVDHENFSALMEDSASGDKEALKELYSIFLSQKFFVPERFQREKLSHEPAYPNDFINILGIKDADRVIIPVFSSKEGPFEWFGEELRVALFTGSEIIKKLPTDWWIVLNPNLDLQKEISPWEIDQIRGGDLGIDAAVNEILPSLTLERTYSSPTTEHNSLLKTLKIQALKNPAIKTVSILIQTDHFEDEKMNRSSIIVGIEIFNNWGAEIETIRESFENSIKPELIGDLDVSCLAGINKDSLSLSIFKNTTPIYVAKEGLSALFNLSRLMNCLINYLKNLNR